MKLNMKNIFHMFCFDEKCSNLSIQIKHPNLMLNITRKSLTETSRKIILQIEGRKIIILGILKQKINRKKRKL